MSAQALRAAADEAVLSRLGRVGVAARHAVESLLAGQHRSRRRGLSVEFAGHRPYQFGDDPRHLDWQVWARTDRLDIRLYEEETRLRATLVVDASGSMAYGPAGRTKLDRARLLAAGLACLMIAQRDAVGLALIDDGVRRHLPPMATMAGLLHLLDALAEAPASGGTGVAAAVAALAPRLTRRGLVILISDGLDDPDAVADALRLLRHRRQDVRVLLLADPDEESFPFQGMIEAVALEREPRLRVDADRIRPAYREALAAHRAALAERCHAAGAPLTPMRTDEDPAAALIRALAGATAAERR